MDRDTHETQDTQETQDVVVAGGGAAGLSAALVLARSRRRVLVVDAGEPRNAPAAGVHAYLGRDGVAPAQLLADGRAEVASYGGEVRPGRVVRARPTGDGFAVELADGSAVRARRLVLATGLVDVLPDVPGLAERWGVDVLHCPFCHGWEVRDRTVGVLVTHPLAVHQAQLFRELTDDLVVLAHGTVLPEEELAGLRARGVRVVEGEVVAVEAGPEGLTGARLASGEQVPLQALAVQTVMAGRADLLDDLGLALVEQEVAGRVVAASVPVDPTGRTSVPGVWAVGNLAEARAQVVTAAAAGTFAGAAVHGDLVAEDVRAAVAAVAAAG